MESITPVELKRLLDRGERPLLLDVREPWEYDYCRLGDSVNVPLSSLSGKLQDLAGAGDVVMICHHGARSRFAGELLAGAGVPRRILNLEGGIDAWATQIDPGMPRY